MTAIEQFDELEKSIRSLYYEVQKQGFNNSESLIYDAIENWGNHHKIDVNIYVNSNQPHPLHQQITMLLNHLLYKK